MWLGPSCPTLLRLDFAFALDLDVDLDCPSKPYHKIKVKGVGQECPTHTTSSGTHIIYYKSTAAVLPPHTRTPTRSPGCGR